ncbi:MFS general substrate transporter [Exidia glandulosa HHB12029]|uniref:MFS general substrate transporter n=1 Tax=Exidia glandulosa HHB12029 TaxID=1314781 RepID=A0A165EL80_EXIGL|nr:MFS general substrate transporter [Exidia glandulosa HHB12029]
MFPEPKAQAGALGFYGGSAALGNVLGFIIGALLVQFANWHWVFRLGALVATPVSVLGFFLIPKQPQSTRSGSKIAYLDLPGLAPRLNHISAALVLLVFAFTTSSIHSWGSAIVLAPLIIAIALLVGFFFFEARIPSDKAAIPPHIWSYPNFALIIGVSMSSNLIFMAMFFLIITMWQDVYGWSAIKSAVHFLPVGLIGEFLAPGPVMLGSGLFTGRFPQKWVLIVSIVLVMIGTILLPFADFDGADWRWDFPAFVIATIGGSCLFVTCNIAVFSCTPPEIAGMVGAMFNSSIQLGSAVILAIITTIQVSVDGNGGQVGGTGSTSSGKNPYRGRAAAFWFLLGIMGMAALAVLVFYRDPRPADVENGPATEKAPKTSGDGDATGETQSGSHVLAATPRRKVCMLRRLRHCHSNSLVAEEIRVGCDLMNLFFLIDEYTDRQPREVVQTTCDIVLDALNNPEKPRPEGEILVGPVAQL